MSPYVHRCCFTLCFPLQCSSHSSFSVPVIFYFLSDGLLHMHDEVIFTHELIHYQHGTQGVCLTLLRDSSTFRLISFSSELARAKINNYIWFKLAVWSLCNVSFGKMKIDKSLFFSLHYTHPVSFILLIRIRNSVHGQSLCMWMILSSVPVGFRMWCCSNQLQNWFLSFCLLYPTNHWRKEQGETTYRFVHTYTFSMVHSLPLIIP